MNEVVARDVNIYGIMKLVYNFVSDMVIKVGFILVIRKNKSIIKFMLIFTQAMHIKVKMMINFLSYIFA